MADMEKTPGARVHGVTEEVKGVVKQAAGRLKGDEGLQREAEAQRDKAEALLETATKEIELEEAGADSEANLIGEAKATEPWRQQQKKEEVREARANLDAAEAHEQRERKKRD